MVVVALRGPRIRAPPNVIATLIRRHFKRPPGAASGRITKLDEQRDTSTAFIAAFRMPYTSTASIASLPQAIYKLQIHRKASAGHIQAAQAIYKQRIHRSPYTATASSASYPQAIQATHPAQAVHKPYTSSASICATMVPKRFLKPPC
jgi:hypothetical protein